MGLFVALLKVDLFFPESGSLKAKRAQLNRIKAWLREREGAAVSEVDHRDTWQRSTLAVAVVGDSEARCHEAAAAVDRRLAEFSPSVERRVLSWADVEAIG